MSQSLHPDPKNKPKSSRSRRKKQRPGDRENKIVEQLSYPRIPELVREDVYLMDNKRRKVQANLLANSLTARIRQTIPAELNVKPNTMQKIRRDSLKDLLHLDNLNKQYTSEMNWEASRLEKESFKLIRRQNQLKRQSENQQKQFERLEAMSRSRSDLSSASLPRLVDSSASNLLESPEREVHSDVFPEFADVDKDDASHVKVFKHGGIFRPQNKYSSTIDLEIAPKLKNSNNLRDSLQMADNESPSDLPSKSRLSRMSKKGLRVSWSSNSQYFNNTDEYNMADSPMYSQSDMRTPGLNSRADSREDNVRTPSTTASFKSIKSDSYLLKKSFTKGRSKVDTVGLKWRVEPNTRNLAHNPASPHGRVRQSSGRLSRNLNPVTTALDREGTSPEKLRWHVKEVHSKSTMEMYQAWLQKVEMLRGNHDTLPAHINALPNRANLSVMTQPV